MKTILCCCMMLAAAPLWAQQMLREVSWETLKQDGTLTVGELEDGALKISNTTDSPQTFELLDLSNPGISTPLYSITGSVKYEGVQGVSYLEMWNHFPGGKSYFSRTMATDGPMRSIEGSSDWRGFQLPFSVRDQSGWLEDRPERLQMNLVLQGKGTVYIRPVTLMQQQVGDGTSGVSRRAWWSQRQAGMVGGYMGCALGLLGSVIGMLAGLAKARRVVMSLLWIMLILGVSSLTAGIAALILKQPYAVYYPLLLSGIIATVLAFTFMRTFPRRYAEAELRRMSAMDA